MVLIGGLSAGLVVLSASGASFAFFTTTHASSSTSTAEAAARAARMPTATKPVPTATPVPTEAEPSPTSVNQGLYLHGSVNSVNQANNTFVLEHLGATYTIRVTATTQYTGTATSLAQIQPDWHAAVLGRQSGSVVVATQVDANPDIGP